MFQFGIVAYNPFPTGKLGPLVVSNGQTVTLTPGQVYDYFSITVEAGGTINTAPGDGWVFLGCARDFNIQGSVLANQGYGGNGLGGTFTSGYPVGESGNLIGNSLSYTIVQNNGGAGGGNFTGGGAQSHGNGGGGSGYSVGNAATISAGGTGGEGNPNGCPGNSYGGGGGGSSYGASGGGGGQPGDGCPQSGGQMWAGGAGGGFRGYHGQGLWVSVRGNIIGSGTFSASGQTGGAGGPATGNYQASEGTNVYGSGGGGSGCGGSGGSVIVYYGGSLSGGFSSSNLSAGGGSGGAGGNAGSTALYNSLSSG